MTILCIVSKGFEYISSLYFLFPVLVFLIVVIEKGKLIKENIGNRIILAFLPFIIFSFVSSIWSLTSLFTIERACYFFFLMVSAYIINLFVQNNNVPLVRTFLPSIILVVILSVVPLLLKLPSDYWSGGNSKGFKGFSMHQNLLGSILLFFIPIINLLLLAEFRNQSKNKKKISLLLVLNGLLLLFLLLTFSRGAIFSYFCFVFFFGLFFYGARRSLLAGILITLIVFALSFFTGNKILNYMIYKGDSKITTSRYFLYELSINAAKEGGIFGLGYGVSSPKFSNNNLTIVNHGVFQREKGSTALALIEEVGVIGLLLFYFPIFCLGVKLLKRLKQMKNGLQRKFSKEKLGISFYLAFIISLFIHSQIEAWGVGVGSVMLPLFMIVLCKAEIDMKNLFNERATTARGNGCLL